MKNPLLLVVFIGGLYWNGHAQNPDCAKFKTGKFIIKDETATSIITRTKDYQYETLSGHKGVMKLKVEWLDDCTYTLTTVKPPKEQKGKTPDKQVFTVHIISTTATGYHLKMRSNLSAVEYEFDLTKVK